MSLKLTTHSPDVVPVLGPEPDAGPVVQPQTALLGLPPRDIPLALLFFNVGVEIGQLLFVLFFAVLTWAFRTLKVVWPEWSEPVPAYAIGTLASYWFIGRFLVLIGI